MKCGESMLERERERRKKETVEEFFCVLII